MKTRFEKLQQEQNDLKQRNFEYENDFKDMEDQQINYCSKIAELESKIQELEKRVKFLNELENSKKPKFLDETIANYKSKIQELENEKSKNKKFFEETIANYKSKIQELENEKSKNKIFFEETIANYTTTKSNNSRQSPIKKDQYGSRSSRDPRRQSDANYQNLDMDMSDEEDSTIKKTSRKSDEYSNRSQ